MSFAAIISNTATVAKATGLVEADYRTPLAKHAEQGAHRTFQVEVTPVAEVYPDLAVAQNRRTATVKVSVAYFAGGGDAGAGDRLSINCQAIADMWALAARLENPINYDSANTGIRRMTGWSAAQAFESGRMVVWDLTQQCEWEDFVPAGAIAP